MQDLKRKKNKLIKELSEIIKTCQTMQAMANELADDLSSVDLFKDSSTYFSLMYELEPEMRVGHLSVKSIYLDTLIKNCHSNINYIRQHYPNRT